MDWSILNPKAKTFMLRDELLYGKVYVRLFLFVELHALTRPAAVVLPCHRKFNLSARRFSGQSRPGVQRHRPLRLDILRRRGRARLSASQLHRRTRGGDEAMGVELL